MNVLYKTPSMPNNHLYFNHCVYKLGYKVYYLGENILIYDIYIYYVARTFCVIFKHICRFIIWAKIHWYMMWYKIIDGHRHFQGKIHIMWLVTCVWYSGISVFSYPCPVCVYVGVFVVIPMVYMCYNLPSAILITQASSDGSYIELSGHADRFLYDLERKIQW